MTRAASATIAVKRPKSQRRYQRFFIIIILSGFLIWSISPLWQRLEQNRELSHLQKQMLSAKSQEEQLNEEIKKLQGDNDYLELMVRKNLGMIRPDEESYAVVEEKPLTKPDKKAARNKK